MEKGLYLLENAWIPLKSYTLGSYTILPRGNLVRLSEPLVPNLRTILRVKTGFSPTFLPLYFFPTQALL